MVLAKGTETYRKIILTLDGSEASRQAIPHVTALAKQMDASVILLEVVSPQALSIIWAEGAIIEPTPVGQDTQEAQANLESVKATIAAEGVTDVTAVVREGDAGVQIVDVADETNADVVVIATHGRSGLGRAILGSVADHVVHHARAAAVLLVRAHE